MFFLLRVSKVEVICRSERARFRSYFYPTGKIINILVLQFREIVSHYINPIYESNWNFQAEEERKKKDAKYQNQLGRKGFYHLPNGDAVMRSFRTNTFEFGNNADISHSVIAIVMHHLNNVEKWKSPDIDLILDIGDQLYIDSYIAYCPKDKKLGLENIIRKFYMNNLAIHLTVYKPIISDFFIVSTINNILQVYFQQETYCILSYNNQWVSLFFKSGLFYVFNPHACTLQGDSVKHGESGSAVLIRCLNLENLVLNLFHNLFIADESSARMFTLWSIDVNVK